MIVGGGGEMAALCEDNGQVLCDKLLTLKLTLSRFNWFNRLWHMCHAYQHARPASLAIRNPRAMTHTHSYSRTYANSLKMLCFASLSFSFTPSEPLTLSLFPSSATQASLISALLVYKQFLRINWIALFVNACVCVCDCRCRCVGARACMWHA